MPEKAPLEAVSFDRFQGKTYPFEQVISVPVTRIDLLPNNPNRLYYRLLNEGAFDVRVSTGTNISVSSGWLLVASGGMLSVTWEEDGEAAGYPLYAIANGGASNVRILEVRRE